MTENKGSWQEKMGKSHKMTQNEVKNVENDKDIVKNANNNDLQQKLLDSEAKVVDLNNKLLRALAEIENLRRRHKEELEKTSNFAISGFVTDLVVVVENFFLACDHLPKVDEGTAAEVKNLVLAVEMTKNEMVKILNKNNVERIAPIGEKFDHHVHEAVSHIPSDSEQGEVIQVIQAGYKMGQRIIRPSLVVVSKGPEA